MTIEGKNFFLKSFPSFCASQLFGKPALETISLLDFSSCLKATFSIRKVKSFYTTSLGTNSNTNSYPTISFRIISLKINKRSINIFIVCIDIIQLILTTMLPASRKVQTLKFELGQGPKHGSLDPRISRPNQSRCVHFFRFNLEERLAAGKSGRKTPQSAESIQSSESGAKKQDEWPENSRHARLQMKNDRSGWGNGAFRFFFNYGFSRLTNVSISYLELLGKTLVCRGKISSARRSGHLRLIMRYKMFSK